MRAERALSAEFIKFNYQERERVEGEKVMSNRRVLFLLFNIYLVVRKKE